ncbi:FAD-dependent thymidylate synthase [Paenibacillus hexagrammi]|uniref:Flavin-dependent thymidylate synthase n=1 Tax=Paenibacillus hexagrammi TaxID=2908839 RepID=A0ABY3SR83_9BACL|nr:FAD-dependent thymidylate synthase [Paenibacillus sp. YPD9-1]UJF36577.1 FAD-dependent thymidylate synthase [Paenibacillus sp. YPD9-1]
MNVKLLAHTQLSREFLLALEDELFGLIFREVVSESAVVALSAIRTCYSPNLPSEIANLEGKKYFGAEASDGGGGSDADRLFRHIVRSGHTSTTEHINYTFAVEGVSRALLAQLTRHRHISFSVQSQRYVRFGSGDKSGGFEYADVPSIATKDADSIYSEAMDFAQLTYDKLRAAGVPAEDARMVLPNGATTNLVMTANLRTLLEFYKKRKKGNGAQWEIAELADKLRDEVVAVDPWTAQFFDEIQ